MKIFGHETPGLGTMITGAIVWGAGFAIGGPVGSLVVGAGLGAMWSGCAQMVGAALKEKANEELHEKQTTQTRGHLKSRLRAHENVAVQSRDNTNQATKAAAPKAAVRVNPVAAKMMQGMGR